MSMWVLFGGIVLVSLAIDLLAHRGGRGHGRRSALLWSIIWIAVALLFAIHVGVVLGGHAASEFVSAYLMEKSLSVDNLFVFMVVFARLQIPASEQHRVLFWGIIGALVARALFIAGGTALLARYHDVVYLLGAFLIYTAYKTGRAESLHGKGESRLLEWLRRHLPITQQFHGHEFIAIEDGRRVATPILLALITIEASDVMFAIDSVPAVFAISEDPFIVYSSNVFAILGLRALYLVLADLLKDLRYLHFGLAAILALAGAKMILGKHYHVPHYISLIAIILILTASIIPSLVARSVRDSPKSTGMRDAREPRGELCRTHPEPMTRSFEPRCLTPTARGGRPTNRRYARSRATARWRRTSSGYGIASTTRCSPPASTRHRSISRSIAIA